MSQSLMHKKEMAISPELRLNLKQNKIAARTKSVVYLYASMFKDGDMNLKS